MKTLLMLLALVGWASASCTAPDGTAGTPGPGYTTFQYAYLHSRPCINSGYSANPLSVAVWVAPRSSYDMGIFQLVPIDLGPTLSLAWTASGCTVIQNGAVLGSAPCNFNSWTPVVVAVNGTTLSLFTGNATLTTITVAPLTGRYEVLTGVDEMSHLFSGDMFGFRVFSRVFVKSDVTSFIKNQVFTGSQLLYLPLSPGFISTKDYSAGQGRVDLVSTTVTVTSAPTQSPSSAPTKSPTFAPSAAPSTLAPSTFAPSNPSTMSPTTSTLFPTSSTFSPSFSPTFTSSPTSRGPTRGPSTLNPTMSPITGAPTPAFGVITTVVGNVTINSILAKRSCFSNGTDGCVTQTCSGQGACLNTNTFTFSSCSCFRGFTGSTCNTLRSPVTCPGGNAALNHSVFDGNTYLSVRATQPLRYNILTSATPTVTAFSFAAWLNPSTLSQSNPVLSLGDESTGGIYMRFDLNSGQGVAFRFGWDSYWVVDSTTCFATQDWHHFMGTYSNSTRTATIYVDGVRTASATGIPPPQEVVLTDTTLPWVVGAGLNGTRYGYVGGMADVRIYSRALSATEVSRLTQRPFNSTLSSSLFVYLPFSTPNLDNKAYDLSANRWQVLTTGTLVKNGLSQQLCFATTQAPCTNRPCGYGSCWEAVGSPNTLAICSCLPFANGTDCTGMVAATDCPNNALQGDGHAYFSNTPTAIIEALPVKNTSTFFTTSFSIAAFFWASSAQTNSISRLVTIHDEMQGGLMLGFRSALFEFGWAGSAPMSTSFVTMDTWHSVVATYSASVASLYIDGNLIKQAIMPSFSLAPTDSIVVGRGLSSGTFYPWFGSIDNFRVYNRAVSSSEALSLSKQGLSALTGLTLYLPLFSQTGQSSADTLFGCYQDSSANPVMQYGPGAGAGFSWTRATCGVACKGYTTFGLENSANSCFCDLPSAYQTPLALSSCGTGCAPDGSLCTGSATALAIFTLPPITLVNKGLPFMDHSGSNIAIRIGAVSLATTPPNCYNQTLNKCNPNPCGWGWCNASQYSYTCTCFQGYYGNNCEFQGCPAPLFSDTYATFPAGSNYLSLCSSLTLPLTISAWVSPHAEPGFPVNQPILSQDVASISGLIFRVNMDMFEAGVGPTFASTYVVITQWTMLTAVLTTTSITLYVNGAQVITDPVSLSYGTANPTGTPLLIGREETTPGTFSSFVGDMDELRVFSRALGAQEILGLVSNVVVPNNLQLYLPFNDTSGFTDHSGSDLSSSIMLVATYNAVVQRVKTTGVIQNATRPLCFDPSLNSCARGPCGLHGVCIPSAAFGSAFNFTCICSPDYTGATCNISAGDRSVTCTGAAQTDGHLLFPGDGNVVINDCSKPIAVDSSFTVLTSFSVLSWVRLNFSATTTSMPIFSHDNGLLLNISQQGVSFGWNRIFAEGIFDPCRQVLSNEWHLLAGTYDASGSGLLSVYMDGVLLGTSPQSQPYPAITQFYLGYDPYVQTNLVGALDEFRLFTRALSLSDIQQYQTNQGQADSALALYLPFSAWPIRDRSPSRIIKDQATLYTFTPTSTSTIRRDVTWPLCLDPNPCFRNGQNSCGSNGACTFVGTTFNCVCNTGFTGPTCSATYDSVNLCRDGRYNDGQLSLNGANLVTVKQGLRPFPSQPTFSILLWARPTNIGPFVSQSNGFVFGVDATGIIATWNSVSTHYSLQACRYQGVWHQFGVTSDGTNTQLYFDGTAVGTSGSNGRYFAVPTLPWAVGYSATMTPNYFIGDLDEVIFSDRALSQTDIASFFSSSDMTPFSDNTLELYLPFRVGSAIQDFSGQQSPYTANMLHPVSSSVASSLNLPVCLEGTKCRPSPCVFGTCKVVSGNAQCTCFYGFSGPNCTVEINRTLACPITGSVSDGELRISGTVPPSIDHCELPIQTAKFTISLWAKLVYLNQSSPFITQDNLVFGVTPVGRLYISWAADSYVDFDITQAIVTNEWHFFAATYSGSALSIFLDDVALNTSSAATSFPQSTKNWKLGFDGQNLMQGWLDEVRIFSYPLLPSDLLTLFRANTLPSMNTYLQLYLPMQQAMDFSGKSISGLLVPPRRLALGDSSQDSTFPFCAASNPCLPNPCLGGSCANNGGSYTCSCFPGYSGSDCSIPWINGCPSTYESGSHALFSSSSSLSIDTCDVDLSHQFTFSIWLRRDTSTGLNTILSQVGTLGSLQWAFNGASIMFVFENFATNTTNSISASCTYEGYWHHFAVTFDPSINSLHLFIDGVSSMASTVGSYVLEDVPLILGSGFIGAMDDLRVLETALPQTDISNIFNSYFVTPISNQAIYLPFDDVNNFVADFSGWKLQNRRSLLSRNTLRAVTNQGVLNSTVNPRCFAKVSYPCFPNPCVNGVCIPNSPTGSSCLCFPDAFGPTCANLTNRSTQCGDLGLPNEHLVVPSAQDVLTVDNDVPAISSTSYTLGIWIRLPSFSGQIPFIQQQQNFPNDSLINIFFGVENGTLTLILDNTTVAQQIIPNCIVTEWHFYAVTTTSSLTSILYIDAVGSSPHISPGYVYQLSDESWVIGAANSVVDDVRFYQRVLSPSEIGTLFQGYDVSPMSMYLPMRDSVVRDYATVGLRPVAVTPIPRKATTTGTLTTLQPLCLWTDGCACVNGICDINGQCQCLPGYYGNQCQFTATECVAGYSTNGYASFQATSSITINDCTMDFSMDFTVEFWVRSRVTAGTASIIQQGDHSSSQGLFLGIEYGNFVFSMNANAVVQQNPSGFPTSWTYFMAVYTMSGQGMTLYVNGVPTALSGTLQTIYNVGLNEPILIGGTGFIGDMDELRFFQRVVAPTDVFAHYTNMVPHWNLLRLYLPFKNNSISSFLRDYNTAPLTRYPNPGLSLVSTLVTNDGAMSSTGYSPVCFNQTACSCVNGACDYSTTPPTCRCFYNFTGLSCAKSAIDALTFVPNANANLATSGITIVDGTNQLLARDFTISLWVKLGREPNTMESLPLVFESDPTNTSHGLYIYFTKGKVQASWALATPVSSTFCGTDWHFFTIVYTPGSTPNLKLWVDSRLVMGSLPTKSSSGPISIGSKSSTFLGGNVDELYIFTRFLLDSEISSLFASSHPPDSSLAVFLPFFTSTALQRIGSPPTSYALNLGARTDILIDTTSLVVTTDMLPVEMHVQMVGGTLKVNNSQGVVQSNGLFQFNDFSGNKVNLTLAVNFTQPTLFPRNPFVAAVVAVGFTNVNDKVWPYVINCTSFESNPPILTAYTEQISITNCVLPAAYGTDLQAVIFYCLLESPGRCYSETGQYLSRNGTMVAYPYPTLLPRTLREENKQSPGPELQLTISGAAQELEMDGTNLYPNSTFMAVFFGPDANVTLWYTTTLTGSRTNIDFWTQEGAKGIRLLFYIQCTNGVNVTSQDRLTYPDPPELYGVIGCTPDSPFNQSTMFGTIKNCPTSGNTMLTVYGDNFVDESGMAVRVGGSVCDNIKVTNPQTLTCTLPPGAGIAQPIVASRDGLFSKFQPFVSYIAAVMTAISAQGCNLQGKTLVGCPRDSTPRPSLTITGTDFGPSDTSVLVLIGTEECTNVVHTSPLSLTCDLPTGHQLGQPVLTLVNGQEALGADQLSISYAQCDIAQFENESIGYPCDICPPGRYGDATGLVGQCKACPVGYYSSISGATTCAVCGLGTAQPNSGQTVCSLCDPGYYSNAVAQDHCTVCAAGTFSPGNGFPCSDCPLGSESNAGMSSCTLCIPGKYSNSDHKCVLCDSAHITAYYGEGSCYSCPLGTYPSNARDTCECGIGLYGVLNGTDPRSVQCITCPAGAACSKQGTFAAFVPAARGYWHATPQDLNFQQCVYPGHCPGQTESNDTGCDTNRIGALCAQCEPGFRASTIKSPCSICPSQGTSWGFSVLFVIGLLAGLTVLYVIVLKSEESNDNLVAAKGSVRHGSKSMIRTQSKSRIETSVNSRNENPNGSFIGGESKINSLKEHRGSFRGTTLLDSGAASVTVASTPITTELNRQSRFTYTFKILLGFLQICSSFAVFQQVNLPSYYQTFIGYFDVINLDFIPWSSLTCAANLTFFTKLTLEAVFPVTLLGTAGLIFYTYLFVANKLDMSDDDTGRKKRKSYRLKFWRLFLFTLFLLYPSVSRSILQFFVCRTINNRSYLVADVNIFCYEGRWNKFVALAVAAVIVYPVGIPAFFFFLIWRRRFKLSRINTVVTYGFLYQAYERAYYWFELVEMLHKLFLTSLVQFVPESGRFGLGMGICFTYFVLVVVWSPYLHRRNQGLALLCEVELIVLLLAGNAELAEGQIVPGSSFDKLLSTILITATIFAFLAFIVVVFIHTRANYWSMKRRKAEEKLRALQGGDEQHGSARETVPSKANQRLKRLREKLLERSLTTESASFAAAIRDGLAELFTQCSDTRCGGAFFKSCGCCRCCLKPVREDEMMEDMETADDVELIRKTVTDFAGSGERPRELPDSPSGSPPPAIEMQQPASQHGRGAAAGRGGKRRSLAVTVGAVQPAYMAPVARDPTAMWMPGPPTAPRPGMSSEYAPTRAMTMGYGMLPGPPSSPPGTRVASATSYMPMPGPPSSPPGARAPSATTGAHPMPGPPARIPSESASALASSMLTRQASDSYAFNSPMLYRQPSEGFGLTSSPSLQRQPSDGFMPPSPMMLRNPSDGSPILRPSSESLQQSPFMPRPPPSPPGVRIPSPSAFGLGGPAMAPMPLGGLGVTRMPSNTFMAGAGQLPPQAPPRTLKPARQSTAFDESPPPQQRSGTVLARLQAEQAMAGLVDNSDELEGDLLEANKRAGAKSLFKRP